MTINRVETLPMSWDNARDTPFFRITARLFTAEFCLGATVLLAGNDDDALATNPQAAVPSAVLSAVPSNGGTSAPATADARPDSDLIPVRVRRNPQT